MQKVECSRISVGMRFSAPVFFDDGEYMFLAEKAPVKKRDLDALARWGVPYLLTDGRPLRDDEPSFSDEEEPEELEVLEEAEESGGEPSPEPVSDLFSFPVSAGHEELYGRYRGLIERLSSVFADIQSGKMVPASVIDGIALKTVELIFADTSSASDSIVMSFLLGKDAADFALAKSSVNTAILTVMICRHRGVARRLVTQVTLGALLHDVGMLTIPPAIINKRSSLTDNELAIVKTHPLAGFRLITNDLHYPADIGNIALQHHERWDGGGYPGGRAGKEIDIAARIVSVADAFEAMISHKTWRSAMIGYQAMKNLLSDNSRRFDPEILKIFIQCIGMYPVSSIVLLNNGVIARVTEEHALAPLRPRLRVLMDGSGKVWPNNDGPEVDLAENKTLFIARALDPQEFSVQR